MKQSLRDSARWRPAVKARADAAQYDGETGTSAISQNFFVGRFATNSFSKNPTRWNE
jgi:hypothetical protein